MVQRGSRASSIAVCVLAAAGSASGQANLPFPAAFDAETLETGMGASGFVFRGSLANGEIGRGEIAPIGDINNDGIDDTIIGANGNTAYVIFGRNTGGAGGAPFPATIDFAQPLAATDGFRVRRDPIGDFFARQVASAGDFNDDGIPDLAIAAETTDTPDVNNDGAVCIVFVRNPDPCSAADVNSDGFTNPPDFNAWVVAFNTQAAVCDQNGDGLCKAADFNSGCP
ncbi:MAG: hypothetical protein AAFR76_09930 [Planctomycetota bacterium]